MQQTEWNRLGVGAGQQSTHNAGLLNCMESHRFAIRFGIKAAIALGLAAGFWMVGAGEWSAGPPAIEAARTRMMGHAPKLGCTKCHKAQAESWLKSAHGNAMENLKPGKKTEEKQKADLDPKKDYSADPDCLGCHTTGYKEGGYVAGNSVKEQNFANVGCETCHGAGGDYQEVKKRYPNDDWAREEIVSAGMKYGDKEICEKCHNKDSPFNAELDPKYAFDYKGMLKKGTHKHTKLDKHAPRKDSEWLYKED